MSKRITLNTETTPDQLRTLLKTEIREKSQFEIHVIGDFRFSHIRSLLAVLNAYAFAQTCQLRYSNEREFYPPPLAVHYTKPPTIHADAYKNPTVSQKTS